MADSTDAPARQIPWLTVLVFAVTAAFNAAQLTNATWMLARLERTPAGLHGDWWRSFTSLFVQDGGALGTASNLAFLLILGICAERVVPRGAWLVAYFGVGLAGEAAGYAWQPTGGGNSVAVCGLAGVVVLALCRHRHGMPFFSAPAVLLWCGALLATWHLPLLAVGIAAAAVTPQLIRAKSRWLSVIVLVVAAGTAVTLISVRNIHGAALMAGLLLAIPLTWRRVSSRDSVAA